MDYTTINRLDGRVALVTDAARGLGSEIAHALMQLGACVMISDVLDGLGNETKTVLATKAPGRIAFMQHDVSQEAEWIAVVQATIDRFGGLDIVVNTASVETTGLLADCELAEFQRTMAVNADGVFLGIKHAIRSMRPGGAAGKGGSIINLSSLSDRVDVPAQGANSASNGAVRMLTQAAAMECSHLAYGIRVNSIHAGAIQRDATPPASQGMPPVAAYGQCSDVANAALFLAGDASRWVTGCALVVDGGATAI